MKNTKDFISPSLTTHLKQSPFRRLSDMPEIRVDSKYLCQTLHINRVSGKPEPIIGSGKSAYYMHSVESSKPFIEKMLLLGINRLYIGPQPNDVNSSQDLYDRRLNDFVEIIYKIKELFPNIECIVDPAGICMGKNLRWGVVSKNDEIDAEKTLALLAKSSYAFNQIGVDGLIAIGRINYEVETIKNAVSSFDKPMKIYSFSTNSETTSAYFETTRYDISAANTGQKIIVGNSYEMMIRAICDFGEGSDVITQKPIEAFHLPAKLSTLSKCHNTLKAFSEFSIVEELINKNPSIKSSFENGVKKLQDRTKEFRIGAYEVSGTYTTIQLISEKYSEELAWSMLDEILCNAITASDGLLDIIISRSNVWYMTIRKQLEANGRIK